MPQQKKVLNSDTISHVNLRQLLGSSGASPLSNVLNQFACIIDY